MKFMKSLLKSIPIAALSLALLNCSQPDAPLPSGASGSSSGSIEAVNVSQPHSQAVVLINPNKSDWRLMATLTLPLQKGFNLSAPFAVTTEEAGDIGWGSYYCYAALKPNKVTFSNLKLVAVNKVKVSDLGNASFSKLPIANAPAGSTVWTNYMPAGTVIACKKENGSYALLEVLSDNPLKVNVYHTVRN
jgi:hypothetical protein